MKKNITPFILMLTCFIAIDACDKVTAPYREEIVVNNFCTTGVDDSIIHRKVMVEDYTGHLCGNCPEAGVFLNDTLKQLYNHCLVVVSVHADFFATTCPNGLACPGNQPPGSFTTDFNTVAGNDWYNFFNVVGNPKGMVNRIDYPTGRHVKALGEWAEAIANQIETEADAKITIQNSYNAVSRMVNTTIKTNFLSELTGDFKLQVVLTEDSIFDWQLWDPPHSPVYVSDFNHRHVMRDVINSTWGELISSGTVSSGDALTKNYSYTIQNNWNADRCSIVAFVYNDITKEVIQVEEQSVK